MKSNRIHESFGDRIYLGAIYLVLIVSLAITLYPLIFIVSASFSDPVAVARGQVSFLPVRPTLMGYEAVFSSNEIVGGFRNSIFYTIAGTLINLFMTTLGAYPLSRKDLKGRHIVMAVFSFTMFFSGGMIPSYLVVRNLGMLNTIWALIIPGAMSVYNVILMRTYFQSTIPEDLWEASQLDGCDDFRYVWSVVLPLSKPIMAVVALYCAVGIWNSYFDAFLYISRAELYPLQVVLRNILLLNSMNSFRMVTNAESLMRKQQISMLLKYALIVVASVPVLIIYPFVQKHFVKGVMIGSLKA